MNTVTIKDNSYAQYESLLLYRDRLKQDCRRVLTQYMRVFGALTIQVFQARVSCIRKRKMIRYIQTSIQMGHEPNLKELTQILLTEMEPYEQKLEKLNEEYRAARAYPEDSVQAGRSQDSTASTSAHVLQPDMHPEACDHSAWKTQLLSLETEIQNILTSEPYVYQVLLNDEALTEKRKTELREELISYRLYLTELDAQLAELAKQQIA